MLAHIAPSAPNRRRRRKLPALPKSGRHARAFADDRKARAKALAHSPDRADPPKAGKHRARQAWCWRSPRPAHRQSPYPEDRRRKRRHGQVRSAPVCAGYRSEEHTSELQSLMRISYAVFCLKKKKTKKKKEK